MTLREHLSRQKRALIERWTQRVLETYPAETAQLMRRKKDRFHNPVGNALQSGIEGLVGVVLGQETEQTAEELLDRIIRIRAVQDFPASVAVGFVFSLKEVVRQELAPILAEEDLFDELAAFEAQVDALALKAFDIYAGCRQQIYQIRCAEMQRNHHMLLRRAGMLADVPPQKEPDVDNHG